METIKKNNINFMKSCEIDTYVCVSVQEYAFVELRQTPAMQFCECNT